VFFAGKRLDSSTLFATLPQGWFVERGKKVDDCAFQHGSMMLLVGFGSDFGVAAVGVAL
jgi:hypothetical protein